MTIEEFVAKNQPPVERILGIRELVGFWPWDRRIRVRTAKVIYEPIIDDRFVTYWPRLDEQECDLLPWTVRKIKWMIKMETVNHLIRIPLPKELRAPSMTG